MIKELCEHGHYGRGQILKWTRTRVLVELDKPIEDDAGFGATRVWVPISELLWSGDDDGE